MGDFSTTSIIGLVVEFVVAIDEARVRFTDDAHSFLLFLFLSIHMLQVTSEDIRPSLGDAAARTSGFHEYP